MTISSAPARIGRRILRIVGIAVLVVVALAVGLFAWVLYEANVPGDGDALAEDLAVRTAMGIAGDLGDGRAEPLDAERLAQRAVTDPRVPDGGTVEVVALGWEGHSGEPDGARVDVAIHVRSASVDGGWFDAGRSAGSSLTCWRFEVRAGQHDGADRAELDCPDEVTARSGELSSPADGPPSEALPSPDPTPLPSLGPDAEATVLATLDELADGATPADAESALRSAFPELVDVRAEREGAELVVTVGVVRSRDCVVGVRSDGEPAWRYSAFDRIQLEPGERGCDPGLYLAPITTH